MDLSDYFEIMINKGNIIIERLLECPIRDDIYEQKGIIRKHIFEIVLGAHLKDIFQRYGGDELGNRL